ncbi:hypothetical protein [Photobacterium sp. GB-3]|uniref:hypothetical protein n=1 Tax=Photobacterium sp. GB-3 TaxID=2022110 RepID=UPI000D178474|nr:hypothetical protein [Photobacterium sp. GB-3]PSV58849.1 hypothetical protein C9J43_00885 [Photobacterium sp. GB-3]
MTNIFQDSLESGREAARNVTENKAQIAHVFDQLKLAIDSLTGLAGKIRIVDEYSDFLRQKPTGYLNVTYLVAEKNRAALFLFRMKQDDAGYPLIIEHKKNNVFCQNQEDLIACISRIFKDGQLILKIEHFTTEIQEQ